MPDPTDEREERVARALRNLRAISQELHALHGHQKNADPNGDDHGIESLTAEVHSLVAAVREHLAAEDRDRMSWWNRAKPWIETVGLGAVLASAIINVLVLLEAKRQIRKSRE